MRCGGRWGEGHEVGGGRLSYMRWGGERHAVIPTTLTHTAVPLLQPQPAPLCYSHSRPPYATATAGPPMLQPF